jgi:hypothetical protein
MMAREEDETERAGGAERRTTGREDGETGSTADHGDADDGWLLKGGPLLLLLLLHEAGKEVVRA